MKVDQEFESDTRLTSCEPISKEMRVSLVTLQQYNNSSIDFSFSSRPATRQQSIGKQYGTHCHVTTFYCMFFSRKWSGYTLVLIILWRARIEISYKVNEVPIVIIESKLTRDIIYHFFIGFSSRLLLLCVDYCCCHHFEYFGC